MSSESNKMKPKTDLELILNYSNQCNWKKLEENESGAGANAASKADIRFSATEPLSEIVWSPDKGFSLRCVDSSFTNKKTTSLFPDVEPTNMVLALLQSVTCGSSTTDKPPIDDVFVEPLAVVCTKSDVCSTDTPARHPSSDSVVMIPEYKACEEHDTGSADKMEKTDTARGTPDFPNGQKETLMNHWEKNICAQANNETSKVFEIMDNKSSTISGQVDQRPIGNLLLEADESKPTMKQKSSPRKHCKEVMDTKVFEKEDVSLTRKEPENMIEEKGAGASGTNLISSRISHLKKLELTSENDLEIFNFEATSAATSRVLVSKYKKNKNKSQVNEMMQSPSNFRFHMTRNESEEKCLSDRYSSLRLSEEENDSYICCETYHSTKLFLSSRKRFKQDVMIGSKKAKKQKQTQENSYSKSLVKRDSSFMNLISNMMKGYSQSNQDAEKSLAPELPCQHKHISHLNNYNVEETREQFADIELLSEPKTLKTCINKEASISIKDGEGNNDHTSKHKFKRITRFPRLRDSEPLVSMFARRLVAIKQCQQTD